MEVYDYLNNIEKSFVSLDEPGKAGIQRQIIEMKDLLNKERNEYEVCPLILFCFICLGLSVLVILVYYFSYHCSFAWP
jgi:hypothetical protein